MRQRKGLKATLIAAMILAVACCFFACVEKPDDIKGVTVLPSDPVTEVVYTVSFDSAGGSEVASVSTTVNKTISEPGKPSKKGYEFVGWFTSDGYFKQWNFGKDIVTSNITLYAKWNLKDEIFIDDDAFVFSSSECVYSVAASVESVNLTGKIVLEEPNYRYAFFFDEECTEAVCEGDSAVFSPEYGDNRYYLRITDSDGTAVRVLKFNVKRNRIFTVSFYDANGAFLEDKTCEEGGSIGEPVDYVLIGFEIEWSDGNKVWSFGNSGTAVTDNVKLYAVPSVKRYTVTLNADGGVSDTDKVTVAFGEHVVFPAPSKYGSGFVGWFTEDGIRVTGSNGVSLSGWNIADDVTLVAVWDGNAEDFIVITTLSGAETGRERFTVAHGESAYLTVSSEYSEIKKEGGKYTVYAFCGWYSGDRLLSTERTYATAAVTANTTVTERWFEYVFGATDNFGNPVDQKLEFSGSESLTNYGNVALGDTVAVKADCDCGKHTFDGWDTNEKTDTVYIRITASSKETNTLWKSLTVSATTYLDGEETSLSELSGAIKGLDTVRTGTTAVVSADPFAKYTFEGWFLGEEKVSELGSFSYVFEMEDESVSLKAKWRTTDEFYRIESEDETRGTVEVSVRAENNVVGGTVSLNPKIREGYILEGLYDFYGNKADVVESGAFTRIIPEEPLILTAKFNKNNISAVANIYDAGAITYKINDGRKKTGSSVGGKFKFDGMITNDALKITAETYDGYVWLGWYEGEELVTVEDSITIASVDAEEAEEGRVYVASWKPAAYEVNMTAGVFAASPSAPSYIAANRYYTYNENTGRYTLCEAGSAISGVTYYTYASDNYAGGTQKATAAPSDGKTGEDVTITATVNGGYRFDGWYNVKDELITFELSYTFNVSELGNEYRAKYTHLDASYPISVQAYGGTSTESSAAAQANAGISYYAYKKAGSNGNVDEICVVTVKTTKTPVGVSSSGTTSGGYNYLGLYRAASDVGWNSIINANPVSPVGGSGGIDVGEFAYGYEINVTEIRNGGGERQNYIAVWRRGSASTVYYVTADISNSDETAGAAYYLGYNSSLTLIAAPNNGYIFRGWYDGNGAFVSSETVYETRDTGRGKTYVARWKNINQPTDERNITIKGAANSEEGGFTVYGTENASGDSIKIRAYTNDGYAFLGWYNGGKLLTLETGFEIVRRTINVNGTTTQELVLYDERGNEVCLVENDEFEPKWRKTDAKVVVDTVGETIITGFMAEDEYGILCGYYRLKVYSPVEYGTHGAAWYDGWFFDGWYNANGELCGEDYELIVPSERLEHYYKAVWGKIDLSVTINTNAAGGSTATYSYYLDDGNFYLVLNAAPADGYTFTGWVTNGATQTRALQYTINLGEFDRNGSFGEYVYDASFASIENAYKPVAVTTNSSSLSAAPSIIGYRFSNDDPAFRVEAKNINGYVFLGWREKDVTGGNYVSTERTYVYATTEYAGALAAVYAEIASIDGYRNFYVDTDKEFEKNVSYYAYYSGENLIIEIAVDLPNGYWYAVTDEEGTVFGATKESPYKVTVDDGAFVGGFTVYIARVSERNGYHTAVEQEIDGVTFGMNGKFVKKTDALDGKTYFEEIWAMNAAFGKDGYSFIGWYDEQGKLLGIYDEYVTGAYGKDTAIITRFGKYEIHLVNTDEEGGRVYVDGYDVTVSFDINTDDETLREMFGGVPSQILNAGDSISYPTQYADRYAAGYMFGGWYEDPSCEGEQFDFDSLIKCDLTLYARWVPISDFEAAESDVLYADGTQKTVRVSLERHDYYFTAIMTGEYGLKVKNTYAGVTTFVCFGEVNGEGKTVSVSTTDEKTVPLQVAAGRTYRVRLYSDSVDAKTVLIRLVRPQIVTSGKRDATVPYGGNVTAIAVPGGFTSNAMSGYYFAGWKTADGTLVTAVRELSMTDGTYLIYPESAVIPYDEYIDYADENGVIELFAYWKKYEIEIISSDLDGGNVGASMTEDPEYLDTAGARKWTLGANARANYTFGGWFLYDAVNEKFDDEPLSVEESFDYYVYDGRESVIIKCEWVYNTESGKYTITYNLNTSDAINSPYNVAGYNSNSTTTILLYNPHKYYKDSSGNAIGYYVFEGWYTDREYKNRITEIYPQETRASINVYAKWGDPVKYVDILTDTDGSRYFYIGIYPQTRITSSSVISGLQADSASYPQGDYRATYRYFDADGTRYLRVSDTLYYRCDPIRWNIFTDDNGTAYARAAVVLDTVKFNLTTSSSNGTYANNWGASELRKWFTNTFLASHFTEIEKNLLGKTDLTVNNAETTGYASYRDAEKYPWAKQDNTEDIAFAPSYSEITDVKAGFDDNGSRVAIFSDYATDRLSAKGIKGYWLRSWGETSSKAFAVGESGELMRLAVDTECGVLPIIRLDTSYCTNE